MQVYFDKKYTLAGITVGPLKIILLSPTPPPPQSSLEIMVPPLHNTPPPPPNIPYLIPQITEIHKYENTWFKTKHADAMMEKDIT